MARLVSRLGVTRYEADEYYRIALASYKKKKLDDAVDNLNYAIEAYPRRAEYYAVRGYFRLQDGLPDDAEPDFDHALKINPYEILANFGKGVIAYDRNHYDIALEFFTKAWAADSERAETLYYLALIYHRQRNNFQAKQFMAQAVDIYSQTAESDKNARKNMKNAEKWIREFDKLITEVQKRAESSLKE